MHMYPRALRLADTELESEIFHNWEQIMIKISTFNSLSLLFKLHILISSLKKTVEFLITSLFSF